MFIQTEDTPNPATLKFLPGQDVLGANSDGALDITDAASAATSPLATELFGLDGVKGVFLGRDFIAVTKSDDRDWTTLKPQILAAIMEHYVSGRPITKNNPSAPQASTNDDAIVKQIIELLETRVRPAVAQDGGDIVFHSYEDGIVYLKLRGACAGCPSATATLKMGVENLLKHHIPEIREVRRVA
ncbi:MAG: NifU family protein, partial [Alphaproteobacteria bacterium]|nr:NifU family protein [Alphaproteobacteria bacterium]